MSKDSSNLSRKLSWALRHGLEKMGLQYKSDGFVYLDDLLKHHDFKNYKVSDIEKVVNSNDKQRFTLKKEGSKYMIKANQGHSMKEVNDLSLERITDPAQLPQVLHGTFFRHWNSIRQNGLNRMNRNHIHFTTSDSAIDKPISGFRSSSQLLIYVNVSKCFADNIEFYRSENGVILSEGLNGTLHPKYFLKVINRQTMELVSIN